MLPCNCVVIDPPQVSNRDQYPSTTQTHTKTEKQNLYLLDFEDNLLILQVYMKGASLPQQILTFLPLPFTFINITPFISICLSMHIKHIKISSKLMALNMTREKTLIINMLHHFFSFDRGK